MALVKRTRLAAPVVERISPAASMMPAEAALPDVSAARRTRERSQARQQKIAERLSAATEELAAGITEASAAAEQLQRAMQQIAAGAEEAAGASQESLVAVTKISSRLRDDRERANASRERTVSFQALLVEAGTRVGATVSAITMNASRQTATVAVVQELDRQAGNISEITGTVSYVSDQTNLLALNAAIEAARAGEHGRGFAIVADEVRALAETSEVSARDVQALASEIRNEVKVINETIRGVAAAAAVEASDGEHVIQAFGAARQDLAVLTEAASLVFSGALQAETAAREVQRGAEQIASAAEEQAAAASQAQQAVQQQTLSLDQSQATAQSLAGLADSLRGSTTLRLSAEEAASAAEQLSATIQELSGASSEILAAIEQIRRGTEMQASAAQQSSAAMEEIDRNATLASRNANDAVAAVDRVKTTLIEGREAVVGLAGSVSRSLDATRSCLNRVSELERHNRRIDKIVNAIALGAVQINMLAVSGAIEAARAGSSGTGFAVVSNDIRMLAREASENAERIRDTVQAIQDQVARVRSALEQVSAVAELEVERNKATIESLSVVETYAGELLANNSAIADGASAILASVREATDGSQQIAAAAQEAERAAAEAATAATQQSRGAEDLAAAIEEIASLADELQQADV